MKLRWRCTLVPVSKCWEFLLFSDGLVLGHSELSLQKCVENMTATILQLIYSFNPHICEALSVHALQVLMIITRDGYFY